MAFVFKFAIVTLSFIIIWFNLSSTASSQRDCFPRRWNGCGRSKDSPEEPIEGHSPRGMRDVTDNKAGDIALQRYWIPRQGARSLEDRSRTNDDNMHVLLLNDIPRRMTSDSRIKLKENIYRNMQWLLLKREAVVGEEKADTIPVENKRDLESNSKDGILTRKVEASIREAQGVSRP